MQSRREFLNVVAKGTGTVCVAGLALGGAGAAGSETTGGAPGLSELLAVLEKAGKPAQMVEHPDGTRVLLLPHGGRVLGVFAPGSEENFFWTHPALRSLESARAFYDGKDWQNSGGERTWLAPEVDIFLPEYPETKTYFQPRQLDPGNYEVVPSKNGVELVNKLTLHLMRSGKDVSLEMTKSVGLAPNPLRYEKNFDMGALSYAGYTSHTTLEMKDDPARDKPPVGSWNLVAMPHGGELFVPTFFRTTPKIYFGDIPAENLSVNDRLVRYKMCAQGEQKIGVRAVASTGRAGYLYGSGPKCALIVRNYPVNPSGEYVDVPWKELEDLGYSTQACNVNSTLGAFSELEHHIPAVGGNTGRMRSDDASQLWAFRGPEEAVRAAARCLLSPEV